MELPSFYEFLESLDKSKMAYDIDHFTGGILNDYPADAFSRDDLELLVKISHFVSVSLLAEYHLWLREKLEQQSP